MRKTVILLLLISLIAAGCTRSASRLSPDEAQTTDAGARAASAPVIGSKQTDISAAEMTEPTAPPVTTAAPPVTTAVPPTVTTLPPVTTTVPTTGAPVPVGGEYTYTTESFRLGCAVDDDERFPKTYVFLSPQDVGSYFAAHDGIRQMNPSKTPQIDALIEKYDDTFFRTHGLILVALEDPSGSIRNTVTAVRRTASDEITVQFRRYLPSIQTCDMAYTYFFLELQTQDLQPDTRVLVQRTDEHAPPSTAYAQ